MTLYLLRREVQGALRLPPVWVLMSDVRGIRGVAGWEGQVPVRRDREYGRTRPLPVMSLKTWVVGILS